MRAASIQALMIAVVIPLLARAATVPAPSETPCEVIVNGRTSTLKSIVIQKTGQDVPPVLHGPQGIGNTIGFTWYVSQHFALKTDMASDRAHYFLTLAELEYPHCVAVVGREPPGIATKRLPFVVATSLKMLQAAVLNDVGMTWIANGGGVTLSNNWVPYIYPSGALQYHINDIVLHENLHGIHRQVQGDGYTPTHFTEGITYMFAQHVYDPERKQLTISVFDRAPINNFTDIALKAIKTKGLFSIEEYAKKDTADFPDPQLLWTAFFWSTPERLMKWRIWRDEMFDATPASATVEKKREIETIRSLFGGFEKLEQEWKEWADLRRSSFTHVDWGWEQWGPTLQSYGFPWDKKYFSQMDINYVLGEELKADPLRVDYPQPAASPLVGPVHFGESDPAVGCIIDFHNADNGGWAGIGLGVKERQLLRVAVQQNKMLVIDGTGLSFRAGKQEANFTPKLLEAAAKTLKTGVTAKIGKDALSVTIRAGEGNDLQSQTIDYPLKESERKTLLERHLALISRDGKHWLTPYLDTKAPPPRDLSKSAGPNRWGCAYDSETYRLYRAAWILGAKAPPELCALRDEMLKAMDQDATAQEAAGAEYRKRIGAVRKAIENVKTDESARALWTLGGLSLVLRFGDAKDGQTPVVAYLWNGSAEPVRGKLAVHCEPNGDGKAAEEFTVKPHEEVALSWVPKESKVAGPVQFKAEAECTIDGIAAGASATVTGRRGIPAYWIVGPFDNKGDGTVDTSQSVEDEEFDAAASFNGKDKQQIKWQKIERTQDLPMEMQHVVQFDSIWKGVTNASAYAQVWVHSPRAMKAVLSCGSDDGIVVWLNGSRIHAALVNRGYSRGSDRVPFELKEGVNKLLFRITQSGGAWCFGAEILDPEDKPIPELKYSLDPRQP